MSKQKKLKKIIKRLKKRYAYETSMCHSLKADSGFLGMSCKALNKSNKQLKLDINFLQKGLNND